MKLKEKLIHLLGGLTIEESQESDKKSFHIGRYTAFSVIKQKADELYGLSAEEWSKKIYCFIEQRMRQETEYV